MVKVISFAIIECSTRRRIPDVPCRLPLNRLRTEADFGSPLTISLGLVLAQKGQYVVTKSPRGRVVKVEEGPLESDS